MAVIVDQHNTMCDRCGVAKARYQVWISRWDPSHDLILCLHHFTQHEDLIKEQGYEVIDLNDEPLPVS